MPSSAASYEEKVTRNLLAVSNSQNYAEAVREWSLAEVFTAPFRCELCGHVIKHNFRIVNQMNGNKLRIGCCCVENYITFAEHVSHSQTVEMAQSSLLRAEEEHIRTISASLEARQEFEATEERVRQTAAFSLGDVAEARTKARTPEELANLDSLITHYKQHGFVTPPQWYQVRKLNRRNNIRNIHLAQATPVASTSN